MTQLSGLRIACLATDGVEQSELTSPVDALRQHGATVEVIAPHGGTIQGFRHLDKGDALPVDRTLGEIGESEYDGLCLPGGAINADALHTNPGVQDLVRKMDDGGKPIAAICHAPWILVSARLVKGRRLTSYHTIRDDIGNAGGEWIDQPVVEDRDLKHLAPPTESPGAGAVESALYARPLSDAKQEFEREYLKHLLETTRGNISEMARISGRYRTDIYRLLTKHGVEWEEFRA